ncbi:nuclear transport factor 2 family protein [Novosphingobium sp. JCM 18896]|uniref:nuclear transport factor 2 family protein n=1 Tax=Novosphingobium sp. JCM 18896 TaxID=2989731 RepID=UPI002222AAFE|nr:nuclear transport factor 2 family protein [Novosphingobium sp. JCM 18896]MCW1431704.1 nuclear transport factor 2 family protein [Novosphingobium sp. JCM 18896]
MSTLADPIDSLAEAFFGALEAGSVAGVLACYTPDARIWHNFDQLALAPEASIAGLRTLFDNFTARRYIEVRRLPTAEGFVQQHILQLESADGRVVDWPGCIVFTLREGLIARLEEYVDLSQLAAKD